MNIILGATGQVGSMLVDNLLDKGQPVRAVVRDGLKAQGLKNKGVEVKIADYLDVEALKKAFQGGSSVFLLTPENPESENFINEIQRIALLSKLPFQRMSASLISSAVTGSGAAVGSETGCLIGSDADSSMTGGSSCACSSSSESSGSSCIRA